MGGSYFKPWKSEGQVIFLFSIRVPSGFEPQHMSTLLLFTQQFSVRNKKITQTSIINKYKGIMEKLVVKRVYITHRGTNLPPLVSHNRDQLQWMATNTP